MAQTAWRCSQCGTVNEPGVRSCRECGKWPSLFDLQDGVADEVAHEAGHRQDVLEPEVFEPEVFRPEAYGRGTVERESFEPEPAAPADGEAVERPGRFPRWMITAIWVIGVLVWIVVNAISDSS